MDMQKTATRKDVKLQIEKLRDDSEIENIKAQKEIYLKKLSFQKAVSIEYCKILPNAIEIWHMVVTSQWDDDDIDVYLSSFDY